MSSTKGAKRAAPEAAGAAAVDERTKRIKKLSPYEHVLRRSTMYVGANTVQKHERALLTVRKTTKSDDTTASDSEAEDGAAGSPLRPETPAKSTVQLSARMARVEYVPAVLKLVDEVITNCLDVAIKEGDVRLIAVTCSGNTVTIRNDGSGLPVGFHPDYPEYRVPEIVFSHLNSGSNYDDDDDERLVAGQNGLGVKLTNIFSDTFVVKVRDGKTADTYEQTWTERMSKTQPAKVKLGKPKQGAAKADEMDEDEAVVVKKRAPGGFVDVSFSPIAELLAPHGTISGTVLEELFAARALDIALAAPPGVRVTFNGVTLKVPNLKAFMQLFVGKDGVIAVDEHDPNWLVGVALAPKDSNGCVRALVNGVAANEGLHVYHVEHSLYAAIIEAAKAKRELKDVSLKPNQLKGRAFLFVVARMTGVTFSSQTKEQCTGGGYITCYKPSELLVKKVLASDIVGEAASAEKTRVARELAKKTDGKKTAKVSVEKLQDAEWAGTARSNGASLILTEGDSARSFAIAGLPKLGFDKYGVFPLRGKLLNTREATAKQLTANAEITNLKKILALKEGDKHEDGEGLRYGSIIILTDSDCVGGNTPLLIRRGSVIKLVEMQHLVAGDWLEVDGRGYGQADAEVWSDNGWTPIKQVVRKKTEKDIYRILTHTGMVDVTEDHKLLRDDKVAIKPTQCDVGDLLLHSFPVFTENKIVLPEDFDNMSVREMWKIASKLKIPYYQITPKKELMDAIYSEFSKPEITITGNDFTTVDEAWVMGFFWADGSAGIYTFPHKLEHRAPRTNYSWSITNCNRDFLEKSARIMEPLYPEVRFSIVEIEMGSLGVNRTFKLIANGGAATFRLIEKYSTFYYGVHQGSGLGANKGNKYITPEILNAPTNVRAAFLDGYYCGDGCGHDLSQFSAKMDVLSMISAQSLFFLCKSLDYQVSIWWCPEKPNIFSLNLTKGHQQWDYRKVKKIANLGKTDEYVYDIETENHHFQAGVGQLVVHNCDGSHIRGLILNFLHAKWPELAKSGFVRVMATPIVRAKRAGGQVRDFYNLSEFNTWVASGANAGWRIKYYKGLGTWTQGDAKALLSATPAIKLLGDEDADDAMALAFEKKKADDRKTWILNSVAAPPVPDYTADMTISAFVNTDLVNFSRYDTERSLPSMLDGLKTSQRKILFAVFQRNYIGAPREVKVAQLSGAVAELTLYLHGEQSLNDAIVGMAQDFVGSNNLPLLFPDGAFGTRIGTDKGVGKDAASPRYIYTYAQEVTRQMFRADDDPLLPRKKEEGFDVEPEAFWPILPMLLINGSIGIGTGFSTNVPMHSPKDVKANVLRFLNGEDLEDMTPHYEGFKGEVVEISSGKWVARGVATRDATRAGRVRITELPPGTSFAKYEELLGDEKSPVTLVHNKSSDVAADFLVDYKSGAAPEDHVKLLKELNLVESISSSNMYAFGADGALKKYASAEALMREWCVWRVDKYEVRRTHLVATLEQRALVARNKARFCKAVATQKLVLGSMEESALCELLHSKDFKEIDGGYDYLLNMGARSFTSDRAAALQATAEAAEAEAQRMRETTAKALWRDDLARLRF